MRSLTFAGIILVALVVVTVNLLTDPQTLNASQMQTMYGGICYSKSEVFTEGCSPRWTCSASKKTGDTDHTNLGTQKVNYTTSGYSSYESRTKDHTCKITSFDNWSNSKPTCSQRKRPSTYWKGPKYTMRGSGCNDYN